MRVSINTTHFHGCLSMILVFVHTTTKGKFGPRRMGDTWHYSPGGALALKEA